MRILGRILASLFVSFILLVGGAVCAQEAPAGDAEWSDIPEVVVRAKIPGPAMWKLTQGESTVWVLGVLDIRPEPLNWNSKRFRGVMRGARTLILPQESTWSPTNTPLPKNQRLNDVVSIDTYVRFNNRVMHEGFSINTFNTYRPVWAGARLMSDIIEGNEISSRIVPVNIPIIARDTGVPIQWLARGDAPAMQQLYDNFDAVQNEACLIHYLDSIDYLLGDMRKVTHAWSRGELKTVMKYHQQMAYTSCLQLDPANAELYEAYAIGNVTGAIREALTSPGKIVVVWPLSDLLRKDGVLDRLRAEGVTISSPIR